MINMHIKQKEISNICSPGMGIFNKDKKKCNKEDSNEINFQLALQYNKFNKKYKNIIKRQKQNDKSKTITKISRP